MANYCSRPKKAIFYSHNINKDVKNLTLAEYWKNTHFYFLNSNIVAFSAAGANVEGCTVVDRRLSAEP